MKPYDPFSLLKLMISTPSHSREEDTLALLFIEELKALGLTPHRYRNNIWVTHPHFDSSRPTLLLNSHIDTVKPNPNYTRNPYEASEENGKIYGLGSNDAGASVVSLLGAFLHFNNHKNIPFNVVFTATAEEEISGLNGIECLLPELEKHNIKPSCAIVGEPTGMQMAIAEKGLLVLDCKVKGVSGHAAREEGENAIYKAMPDIDWFKNFKFEKTSPLLGPNKMTVTVVQAGTQHNVVPGECQFVVDVRINELYDFESVLDTVRKHVGAEVKPRSMRIRSTSISLDHPLVKAGLSLGLTHYGSPTTSDKALMPFPALKMGPGESPRSHTADEFVFKSEIEQGMKTYIQLLEGFFKISGALS